MDDDARTSDLAPSGAAAQNADRPAGPLGGSPDAGPPGADPTRTAAQATGFPRGSGAAEAVPPPRRRSPRPAREPSYQAQGISLLPNGAKAAALVIAVIPLLAILLVCQPWSAAGASSYPGGGSANYNPFDQSPGYAGQNDGLLDDTATTPDPTDADTASPADPDSAAESVTQLLQSAATDRASVGTAVADAEQCGSGQGLSTDLSSLQAADSDQQDLSSQVGNLDLSVLDDTGQLAEDLSTAFADSATADGDFASWVADLQSGQCTAAQATADSDYASAGTAGEQATADKATLVQLWNPIAQQYDQPTWSATQI